MKRLDFLKELKKGLFKAVTSVYEPIVSDEMARFENLADNMLGINWSLLGSETEFTSVIDTRFIAGKPVIVFINGTNMQAFSGICPVCSHLISVTTLYASVKCLICDKQYQLEKSSGDFQLEAYYLKKVNGMFYIGKKKSGVQNA